MRFLVVLASLSLFVSTCCGQHLDAANAFSSSAIAGASFNGGAAVSGQSAVTPSSAGGIRPFSTVAVGVKLGVLGIGFEAATPLSTHLNLRGGANFFNYSDIFSTDGISYDANLYFRTAEASIDWFPWAKGFHISPGALLYNGNEVSADATVPAGSTFTLNDTTYTSGTTDPVSGTGSLKFNKAAPKLTVGWGNMIPRSGRHFSIPFEVGFAYVGDPKVVINLNGTACYNYQGQNYCSDVATNPMIQANLAAQQQKINHDVAPARFFPLISTGFSYRF